MRIILKRLISSANLFTSAKKNVRLCSSDAQKKPEGESEAPEEVKKSKVMFTIFLSKTNRFSMHF